jgi:hypothetical protein
MPAFAGVNAGRMGMVGFMVLAQPIWAKIIKGRRATAASAE